MRIERHHELRPIHTRPDAEVDTIPPNHPAEVEVETLAGAPIRRSGKEVPDPTACRRVTIHRTEINVARTSTEIVKGRSDIFSRWLVSTEKELLDRACRFNHVA